MILSQSCGKPIDSSRVSLPITLGQEQQETQQGQSQVGGKTPGYEKQIAERDEKIASLEAQVAEEAKNAETQSSVTVKTRAS